jgi:hypothetical protein
MDFRLINFLTIFIPCQVILSITLVALGVEIPILINIISALKELILLTLFFIIFFKNYNKIKLDLLHFIIAINIIIIFFYFFYDLNFDTLKTRIFGLKFSIFPIIGLLIGLLIDINLFQIKKNIKLLLYISILLVFFGIFEILFIQREFLVENLIKVNIINGQNQDALRLDNFLYFVTYGDYSYTRMVSTFISPLTLAYFLILPNSILVSQAISSPIKNNNFMLYILNFGIFLTLTRAVILPFLLLIGLLIKFRFKIILIVLSSFIIFYNDNIFYIIYDTLTLEDPSAYAHYHAYSNGFQILMNSLWGNGLGEAGPIGNFISSSSSSETGVNTNDSVGESLYMTIFFERGIVGLLLFTMLIGIIFYLLKKNSRRISLKYLTLSYLLNAVLYASFIFIIASITTEHWFGIQSSIMYWIYCGITLQLTYKISR